MHSMKRLKIIALIIVVLVSFVFFGTKFFEPTATPQYEIEVDSSIVEDVENDIPNPSLTINGFNVDATVDSVIQSSTLRPMFEINAGNGSLVISFEIDGFDIINDPQLMVEEETTDDGMKFKPSFLLSPGSHNIKIIVKDGNESQEVFFDFVLNLTESFTTTVGDSEFFVIPDSTLKNHSESWYTDNGKLKIGSIENGHLASISFLYAFADVDLTFSFKPSGDPLNLVFYFLDRGRSLVIGNGNLNRITLLRDGEDSVEGKPFSLDVDQTYKARIVRTGDHYDLYLALETDEWTHVLSYTDDLEAGDFQDSIGFSVWPGSKGVEIDDLSFFEYTP